MRGGWGRDGRGLWGVLFELGFWNWRVSMYIFNQLNWRLIVDFDRERDQQTRRAAFEWLGSQVSIGGVVSRDTIARGFEHRGRRVQLVGRQGIVTPETMELPLSIRASQRGPYANEIGADLILRYRYRGSDPYHSDNVGLRHVMLNRLPLVYFHGMVPNVYIAIWPVYVVGESITDRAFLVTFDNAGFVDPIFTIADGDARDEELARKYGVIEG